MITRNDLIILLKDIKDTDTTQYIKKCFKSDTVDISVLKFINDNRPLELTRFYEKLRKSYNAKKSKLYINIVKNNFEQPKDILSTLCSLQLQITLFGKDVEDYGMFLSHARFEDISACLLNYSRTADLIPCIELLKLIKADLKVCEEISGRDIKK